MSRGLTLESVTTPHDKEDFVHGHPMFFKPCYWETYGAGVVEALKMIGVPVVRPNRREDQFVITWHFRDRSTSKRKIVRTGLCYADNGPVPSWHDIDGLLAMRWHPSRHSKGEFPFSVAPAGFPLSVAGGKVSGLDFIAHDLARLRALKDYIAQSQHLYYNEGHFRIVGRLKPGDFPNRLAYQSVLMGREPGVRRPSVPYDQWHRNVATHATTLNLCGTGNSIDRKVTEMCAIGTVIVSDRGLETLSMPNGKRFIHQNNIWFVDSPEEAVEVSMKMGAEQRRAITAGARLTFEEALSPLALGRWYLKMATEWAKGN
jgi:hypothetical protein